tara:strand:- start:13185 stop:14612 length:1428 start_codon:yes stop_codon:yes gene_type:complete
MGIKLTNNAFATLAAGINSSATSITLTSGQGARFPTLAGGDYFYATLVDTSNNLEIVKCTARSTDVLTVVRAQETTTARAYSTGDRIEIRITAQTFIDAITEIPSQTGNSGKYLTTDGTNVSWGIITAPTPTAVSDQNNTSTGYFDLPSGTTAQRPASPAVGMIRFNTTLNYTEEYRDGVWQALSNVFTAEGGTVTTSGSYKIHTFTSSGTFTVLSGTKAVEYLVVAGGAGGGGDSGGGGGAGGYRSSVTGESSGGGASAESQLTLGAGGYTVTVGAGGAGSSNTPNGSVPRGTSGQNSVFSSITSLGGGGGGAGQGVGATGVGLSGGSGGGGGGAYPSNGTQGAGGSGTSGQGYAGAAGNSVASPERGGGGGGAGGVGTTGSSGGGNGGVGVQSSITGSAVYRGGGGGGGAYTAASTVGQGGNGGGGNGATAGVTNNAVSGTANTGGGGGSATESGVGVSGNGGSGIVIIRYVI